MMRLNTSSIYQNFKQFHRFRDKLSETGQKSISCAIVRNAYDTASHYYNAIGSSLKRERDESGNVKGLSDPRTLLHSPRLEHEITCLVTSLLNAIPRIDMDKLLNQDPEVTEEDRPILKEAYISLTQKIEVLDQLLGLPCFARKKPEEESSDSIN